MDFSSASSPASSSTDSRSSYSPHLMSSDLGLDPSDPLNLLLHNTSQSNPFHSDNLSMDESSQEGESPPDWSQLSALWPDHDLGGQTKPYGDVMDFSDLAMDIDFNPSVSIEPSALHFNPMKFNLTYSYDAHTSSYPDDLVAGQFPFTFQSSHDSASSLDASSNPRRLSITSSSSSGASLSPAPESAVSPSSSAPKYELDFAAANFSNTLTADFSNDPAAALAERVRQSAGVMLALPMSAQLQAFEKNQQEALLATTNSPTSAPKLPIPRLPQHMSQSVKSISTTSSAASTPPPSTPSPASIEATPNTSQAALPRPKTSHTTIERRYRTNLNARIQSLRMAVPALRVVEDREGGKKKAPNKVLVSSDPMKMESGDVVGAGGIIDVIDERGFVDGVKVARKCSKANVLGKAVEYIRVLKKRENRLKAEQSGLKSLISGLVGGPALLREWEREWKELFGGEEKDEVEGEMEADADEDDSDEEQDDGDEEGGRKRKRGKVSPSGAAAAKPEKEKKEKKLAQADANGVITEKRKRGRPRKVIPAVPSIAQDAATELKPQAEPPAPVEQSHAPQQYLLATFALFSFFNSPLTPSATTSSPSHVHTGTVLNAPAAVAAQASWGVTEYLQMFHLIVSTAVLLSFVLNWIGLGPSASSVLSRLRRIRKEKTPRADWIKLGEECIFAGSKQDVPLLTRVQAYHRISTWSGAGLQDITTAAMALYGAGGPLGGVARIKARAVWAATRVRALAQPGTSVYERMVLEGVSVDEAIARLGEEPTEIPVTRPPMQVLGNALVKERVRKHLGLLFVGSVQGGDEGEKERETAAQELGEREETVEAAKELGGHVGELGRKLERAWKLSADCELEKEGGQEEEQGGIDGDIAALLTALVLYRRVFSSIGNGASALLSPPPSPGRKDTSDAGMLRRALGSRVFEEVSALEDARDRAVDMVVELERRSVGLN